MGDQIFTGCTRIVIATCFRACFDIQDAEEPCPHVNGDTSDQK